MDRPVRSPSPASRGVRRRTLAGAAATFVVLLLLAGCSSDDDAAEEAQANEAFCAAIQVYAEKAETGDKASMADALSGLSDELSGQERRIVDAHIAALTSVSSNHPPQDHHIEENTAGSLRELARKNCGDDVLPEPEPEATDDETPAATDDDAPAPSPDQNAPSDERTGDPDPAGTDGATADAD